tara:strand:- start:542 stop:733 length:192 start_codon:yes stop_codon:yes gene_type:complete
MAGLDKPSEEEKKIVNECVDIIVASAEKIIKVMKKSDAAVDAVPIIKNAESVIQKSQIMIRIK